MGRCDEVGEAVKRCRCNLFFFFSRSAEASPHNTRQDDETAITTHGRRILIKRNS